MFTLAAALLMAAHPCLPFEHDARATAAPAELALAPLPTPPILHRVPMPLAAPETARYRLSYGVLSIGEATVAVDGAETVRNHATLRVHAHASGSFVGLGGFDKRVEVGFDPVALAPRPPRLHLIRYTPAPSIVAFDPVSLLLRLRADPPAPGAPPLVVTVADGKRYWRVTITSRGPATLGEGGTAALQFAGRAEPVGKDERVPHDFTLWLAADPSRLPLRLEMPLGVADLTVSLIDVHRGEAPAAADAARK
jgi:hypothetical protein